MISSYQQLSKFCARLSPKLASHVETLVVDIPFVKTEEDEYEFEGYDEESRAEAEEAKPMKETIDAGWPKNEQLVVMLRMLEEVEEVEMKGSTRIALLVLSPQIANSCLPELQSLALDTTFDGIDDPFHSSHYSALLYYDQLLAFEVRIQRPFASILPSTKPLPTYNILPVHLYRDLRIEGPLGASPYASSLVSISSALDSLRLCDSAAGTLPSKVLTILEAVEHPERVSAISLECTRRQTGVEGNLSNTLSRFSTLEVLGFVGQWPALSGSVYKLFGKLPIRELCFGPKYPVSLARLKELVHGPSKSSTLRLLNLSNVESKSIRLSAAFECQLFGPHWEDVPPSTSFAKWTRNFSKGALYDLLESTADDETLRIYGTAVEALVKEDIWMPARQEALWRHHQGGDGDEDIETDNEWETSSSASSEGDDELDSDEVD